MHTIKTKMIIIVTAVLVTLSVSLCGMSYYYINHLETEQASDTLNRTCVETSSKINKLLYRTEDAVNLIAYLAVNHIKEPARLYDNAYREDMSDSLKAIFMSAAERIDGSKAFYVYYNRDMIKDDGFYFVKNKVTHQFEERKLKEIEPDRLSEEKDREILDAWYDEPVEKGKSMWISPNYDDRMEQEIISYVVPLYSNGGLIAVAGIDILFSELTDLIDEAQVFKSGYGFLCGKDIKELYYNADPETEDKNSLELTLLNYDDMKRSEKTGTSIIPCRIKGKNCELAFSKLANGMYTGVIAPDKEIFAERKKAVDRSLLITTVVLILSFITVTIAARNMTVPLRNLIHAARMIQKGDYSVRVKKVANDEIGELTDTLNLASEIIEQSILSITEKAYRDELTRVKNPAAYDMKIKQLTSAILNDEAEFAVVMVDMNQLKRLNDTFGHAEGDIAIKAMCSVITRTYDRSPVFRIGGDEFVVILEKEDYEDREKLIEELRKYEKLRDMNQEEPWTEVALSAGMAVYDPRKDHTYQEVFSRADARMYEKKRSIEGIDENPEKEDGCGVEVDSYQNDTDETNQTDGAIL